MIYKFKYKSKNNFNDLVIMINNEKRKFIIYKSGMMGYHLERKIKELGNGLDPREFVVIELKTKKDFEKYAFILREDPDYEEI